MSLRWWLPVVLGMVVLGVAAGVLWWSIAPRSTGGIALSGNVAYPTPDDPSGTIAVLYVLIVAACGLISGALMLGRAAVATTRIMVVCGGGWLAAIACYVTGYLLGPASVAAQLEAGAAQVQVPLSLPTPLLSLVWPAATATVVSVGMLISLVVQPPRPSPVS